jgi:hypothetical protein
MLPESLRAVANMLEEIQRVQKITESRLSNHDAGLEDLKAELQRQVYVQERYAKEIHRLKQELDLLKSSHAGQDIKNKKEAPLAANSADGVKASAEEAPPVQQEAVKENFLTSGDFYKTASAKKTSSNYITASVPLGHETQAQPAAPGYAAKAQPVVSGLEAKAPQYGNTPAEADTGTAGTSRTVQNSSPEQKSRNKGTPQSSQPILPGSGFSHITIDFLRKLGEK